MATAQFSATVQTASSGELYSLMFDKFEDECGVFGIYNHPEAANMTYRAAASRPGKLWHFRI